MSLREIVANWFPFAGLLEKVVDPRSNTSAGVCTNTLLVSLCGPQKYRRLVQGAAEHSDPDAAGTGRSEPECRGGAGRPRPHDALFSAASCLKIIICLKGMTSKAAMRRSTWPLLPSVTSHWALELEQTLSGT